MLYHTWFQAFCIIYAQVFLLHFFLAVENLVFIKYISAYLCSCDVHCFYLYFFSLPFSPLDSLTPETSTVLSMSISPFSFLLDPSYVMLILCLVYNLVFKFCYFFLLISSFSLPLGWFWIWNYTICKQTYFTSFSFQY